MKKQILITIAALTFIISCGKKNPLAKMLPEVEGFQQKAYKSCSQEKSKTGLSECLDGFAEKVIPLGVQSQVIQDYGFTTSCKKNEEGTEECDRTLGITITDFATEEGAFGYYSIVRTPPVKELKNIENGEGYIFEQRDGDTLLSADVYVWKGKFVFSFQVDNGADLKTVKKLAKKLAKKTPGEGKRPAQLKYFPKQKFIPQSEKYMAVDFAMNPTDSLQNVAEASYTAPNNKTFQMFISDMTAKENAKAGYRAWKQFAKKEMKQFQTKKYNQYDSFTYVDGLGSIVAVMHVKQYVIGAYGPGITNPAQAAADLSLIYANFK